MQVHPTNIHGRDGAEKLPIWRDFAPGHRPGSETDLISTVVSEIRPIRRSVMDETGWPDAGVLFRLLLRELDCVAARPDSAAPNERLQNLAAELQVAIDHIVGSQLAILLNHPRFRQLESAWRGLAHVVEAHADCGPSSTEVWVADYGAGDLRADLGHVAGGGGDHAAALTRTWLFKSLYEFAWDQRGAKVVSLLVSGIEFGGDGEVSAADPGLWPDAAAAHRWRGSDHEPDRTDGVRLLHRIAEVAELSFCPFVASASPLFFGLPDFSYVPDEPAIAPHVRAAWDELRGTRDSRFVGLVAPRIVLRRPLAESERCGDWFTWPQWTARAPLCELTHRPLLGSGAYALAAVVIRSVAVTNWPADIHGAEGCGLDDSLLEGGGLLRLTQDAWLRGDVARSAARAPIELTLTGQQERRLADLGFCPIARVPHTGRAAFHAIRMTRRPEYGAGRSANATQEMHSLLPYMLIAARFAHVIRVISQRRHGQVETPAALQQELENWIGEYVGDSQILRRATVRVARGAPGKLHVELEISPRLWAEDVEVAGMIPLTATILDERETKHVSGVAPEPASSGAELDADRGGDA